MEKKHFISYVLLVTVVTSGLAQENIRSIDSSIFNAQYQDAISQIDNVLNQTSHQDLRIDLENKKADALIRDGRLEEAEKQLEIIKQNLLTPYQLAITEKNSGLLYLNQGRNDLALTSLLNALANIEKESKQNTLEGAMILSHLGTLYLTTGKYAQAQEQLAIALDIREKLVKRNSELIAASYNDLGLVYSVKDADKALDYYEKALIIYKTLYDDNHAKIATAKTNIGFAYRTLELYGDAIINLESALTTWDKIYQQSHPTKAFILFNLGQTYLKMRNEKAAEGYYMRALKMYEESYDKKHPAIATVLNAMGRLRFSSCDYDEALDFYQQAIISNVRGFEDATLTRFPYLKDYYSGNTLLFSLLGKAETLEANYFGKSLKFKELLLAIRTLDACDTLIDNLRQQITNESDKIALGNISTEVYTAGVRIAYEAAKVAVKKNPLFEKAFYFAEKSKSAVLLEAISDANAKSFSGVPPELLEEERKLKAEIALTAQKLSSKPTEIEEKYLRQVAFTLNRSYENFTLRLEQNFPSYFNLKFNVSSPSIKSLKQKLNSATAIISYFTDDKNKRVYIFQITKKKFGVDVHPLPEDFEKYISGLRNSLVYNELQTYKVAAERLSILLVPKNISPTITELVILSTGRLSIIPFETLFSQRRVKQNNFSSFPYLVKKYSIRYEFSAGLILQKSKAAENTTASIFLCAPVTFQKANLHELPASESEVNEISELFSKKNYQSTVFVRSEADEKIIKTGQLKDHSFLHFATHGIVDETNPELSKIFLSSSTPDEDGSLFSSEIYNLELSANLVTLSACQTGLGKITKGEGVIGLSRALVYAGSKNIIVSFWSVADESTAMLMKDFYAQMLDHGTFNFSQELRQAKLNLIKGSQYASPYYWAPFVLIGF